jgi:hypothetical protein
MQNYLDQAQKQKLFNFFQRALQKLAYKNQHSLPRLQQRYLLQFHFDRLPFNIFTTTPNCNIQNILCPWNSNIFDLIGIVLN